jgi:hypothetical protein
MREEIKQKKQRLLAPKKERKKRRNLMLRTCFHQEYLWQI